MKTGQRLLVISAATALIITTYLWLTLLSPFGYTPPAQTRQLQADTDYAVFAYGTLTSPWVRRLVMGRAGQSEAAVAAVLPGYRRQGLDLIADPQAQTPGVLFTVNGTELARLDRYERLGVRYQRKLKPLANGQQAWVYRRLDQHIDNE